MRPRGVRVNGQRATTPQAAARKAVRAAVDLSRAALLAAQVGIQVIRGYTDGRGFNIRLISSRSLKPVALAALAALAFGATALTQDAVPSDDVTQKSLVFAGVYSLIEKNYVDPVNPDAAILEGGIRGMLATLDPFSAFFNPDQFATLKQQAQGRAVGFGTVLYVTPGKIVVLESAEKSPAWRAGLGPGDEIVEVNGQRIDRLDFRSLVELLQRARSRPVALGIVHPGKLLPVMVKLNPAEVALPTVDTAFLLRPGIAYLHLSSFEAKTPEETYDAITRLGGANLKGLLLDLRGNHGGIVDAAVGTVSLFMPPGLTVLTMKGRAQPAKTDSTVQTPGLFTMPLVVLVNGETASAAEIAAAALEEHDRALIAGSPTFGKGLVQQVMPLDEKMGLALITAQYFTPSGRSIQRPLPGTALADTQPAPGSAQNSPHFRTDNGRPLEAGGAITPDVEISAPALDPWAQFLDQRGVFATFASDYLTRHGRVSQSFEPDGDTLDDFRDYLQNHDIRAPGEYWDQDAGYLKLRIKTEIFNLVFGLAAGNEVQTRGDVQVEKAVALLPQVPELLRSSATKIAGNHARREKK
jgi:carboxyl-terminal processing protease